MTVASPPKACIIGAGCSGFTPAKPLKDYGIPFDCSEISDNVCGDWCFKNPNGLSACDQSPHIDTSKSAKDEATHLDRYYPSARHSIQVDFNLYVRDLHAEIKAGEKRAARLRAAAGNRTRRDPPAQRGRGGLKGIGNELYRR